MKIVLVEIVKNEGSNIDRNLISVCDLVDGVAILDTGSTDNTVERIEHVCTTILKKPFQIKSEPFVNFGVSRSASFRQAQEFVLKQGWLLTESQALVLDADAEVIEFQDASKKLEDQMPLQDSTITKFRQVIESEKPNGVYQIHQLPQTSQHRIGLMKMSAPWECKNACHEYWDGPSDASQFVAPWKVYEKPTGGNKATKLERELHLLHDDIVNRKNDTPRNQFYQGRALDSAKRPDEAIEALETCISKSEWNEERQEARLIIARIWALRDSENIQKMQSDTTKQWKPEDLPWPFAQERSMRIYWQAHNDCPFRCESLFFVAFHHKLRKEFLSAVEVLRIALETAEFPREVNPGPMKDRPDIAWTSLISSLFNLGTTYLITGSKRKSSLFHNTQILHDNLLEELAHCCLQVADPEWRLRGNRAAEFLSVYARSETVKENAKKILQIQITPPEKQQEQTKNSQESSKQA